MIKWFIAFVCCFSVINISVSYAEVKEVTLRAGVPVLLSLKQEINGKTTQSGDVIKFVVIRAVKTDDLIVIDTNTEALGKVAEIKKAGSWGRKGEISISIDSTIAVDGTEIRLDATQKREGKSKSGTATTIAATTGVLLCPIIATTGFLVKGEDGSFPAGYEIKAYVDDEYKIKVDTSWIKTIANVAPIVNVISEISAVTGELVILDGSKSSDPDGGKLTYKWGFVSTPSGSTVSFKNPDSDKPTFKPDVPGMYVVNLVVNDGQIDSEPAKVVINVTSLNEGVFK